MMEPLLPPKSSPPAPIKARTIALAVALGLLATAVYLNNLGNGFVMDDRYNVVGNAQIRQLDQIPAMFTRPWGADAASEGDRLINRAYWRPLVSTSYALNHALGGLNAAGYHLVNNLLHGLVCFYLVLLLLRLGLGRVGVLAGGLIFALHPIHTEAVNLISYRNELMAALFAVIALWVHAGSGARAGRDLLWLPLLYAMGLASKESAVTLPLWLFLLDLSVRSRPWGPWRPTYVPLALVLGGYLLLRQLLLGPSALPFFGELSGGLVLLSVMKIYLLYLRLLLVPWPLVPFWDWTILPPASSFTDIEAWAGLLALVITLTLIVLLWRARREASPPSPGRYPMRPLAALGLGWWIIGLIPFSHLVPLPVGAAERFLYFPSVGIALAAAAAAQALWPRLKARPHKILATVTGILICLLMSLGTLARNQHWRSDQTLMERAVKDFPESFNAHYTLGKLFHEAGQLDHAIKEYTAADKILPNLGANVERLAHALLATGRPAEALATLDRALAEGGDQPRLWALRETAREQRAKSSDH